MTTIEEILKVATKAGASDVHLTVGISPKMRINGNLVTMNYPMLLAADILDITLQIMKPFQREQFEKCGEYDMSYFIPDVGRYRVSAFRQSGKVALAFRIISQEVPLAEELGLPELIVDLYNNSQGLIIVTGPAGCGKTSTVAAIIDKINRNREVHIITIEDPIEYVHQHRMSIVNQREIGTDSGSYADALQAAFREDPDVIFIGELRGAQIIENAIAAAEAGHLVLTTMNTVGAHNTIDYIVGMYPQHRQQQLRSRLADVVKAIVSQQLIPDEKGEGRKASFEILNKI